MKITFYPTDGTQPTKPATIDAESSKISVYIRRNIHEVEKEIDGETYKVWQYEEAKIKQEDYPRYLAEDAAAKIEYLAMMADIDMGDE